MDIRCKCCSFQLSAKTMAYKSIHRVFCFFSAFLLISTPLLLSCGNSGSDLNINRNKSGQLSQKGLSAKDQDVTMDSQVTTPYPGETTESPLGLSVSDRITVAGVESGKRVVIAFKSPTGKDEKKSVCFF